MNVDIGIQGRVALHDTNYYGSVSVVDSKGKQSGNALIFYKNPETDSYTAKFISKGEYYSYTSSEFGIKKHHVMDLKEREKNSPFRSIELDGNYLSLQTQSNQAFLYADPYSVDGLKELTQGIEFKNSRLNNFITEELGLPLNSFPREINSNFRVNSPNKIAKKNISTKVLGYELQNLICMTFVQAVRQTLGKEILGKENPAYIDTVVADLKNKKATQLHSLKELKEGNIMLFKNDEGTFFHAGVVVELESGQKVVLSFTDSANDKDEIEVQLSPIDDWAWKNYVFYDV